MPVEVILGIAPLGPHAVCNIYENVRLMRNDIDIITAIHLQDIIY